MSLCYVCSCLFFMVFHIFLTLSMTAMWLRDLTYFYETNSDFLDEENSVINLQKLQQISKTIYDLNLRNCSNYDFVVDLECKDTILYTLAMALDAEDLYETCLVKHPVNQRDTF